MILVDSNVIIDVLTEDPKWREWSEAALRGAADRDEVAINPIIYAELASGFATIAALDRHLGVDGFERLALPYEAGFVAGRAFVEYRRRWWRADIAVTGFLHRGSCGGRWPVTRGATSDTSPKSG